MPYHLHALLGIFVDYVQQWDLWKCVVFYINYLLRCLKHHFSSFVWCRVLCFMTLLFALPKQTLKRKCGHIDCVSFFNYQVLCTGTKLIDKNGDYTGSAVNNFFLAVYFAFSRCFPLFSLSRSKIFNLFETKSWFNMPESIFFCLFFSFYFHCLCRSLLCQFSKSNIFYLKIKPESIVS